MGYGAAERRSEEPADRYHLFVVTLPEDLATVGARILRELDTMLARLGARGSWLREHAGNAEFVGFLEQRGYTVTREFEVNNVPLAILEREHGTADVREGTPSA